MSSVGDCFKSIIKLQLKHKYQSMFVVSHILWNSYDFWLYLDFLKFQESSEGSTVFSILKVSGFQVVVCLSTIFINSVSFLMSLYIGLQLFILKRATFMLEIQQKILFPIMVFVMTIIFIRNSVFSDSVVSLQNFVLQICYSASILYPESLEKGLNRVFKDKYIIVLIKFSVTFVFAIFLPDHRFTSLVVISCINLSLNVAFRYKVFYEHPSIQFIALVNQFFIWIPTICGFLHILGINRVSLWILYIFGCLGYMIIAIQKPAVLMFLLEKKYLHMIRIFSKQIRAHNGKEQMRVRRFREPIICYLSIVRNLVWETQFNQLHWSSFFKNQFFETIKLDAAFLAKSMNNQELQNQCTKTFKSFTKYSLETQNETKFHFMGEKVEPTQNFDRFDSDGKTKIKFLEAFYQSLGELLFTSTECPNDVRLYCCYYFFDFSNKMKSRIFYAYFSGVNSADDIFEMLNFEACYKDLMDKINNQKSCHPLKTSKSSKMIEPSSSKSLLIFFSDTEFKQKNRKYCMTEHPAYFNSKFNQVIDEHKLNSEILNELYNFIDNEQFYIDLHHGHRRYDVREYLRNRNKIRRRLQTSIEDYARLGRDSVRLHMIIIFNYIKDFYLRQDAVIAYDKFKDTLQNWAHKMNLEGPNQFFQQFLQNYDSNKISCVTSVIREPDAIFTSCSEFKRLLEIDQQKHQIQSQKNYTVQKKPVKQQSNEYKAKINNLLLPMWRDEHRKFMNNKIIDEPIDHSSKRYFLQSLKHTNVLQVKFKMHFHMLYEKDLLIVLDIDHKLLNELIITDTNDVVLYSHSKPKLASFSTTSIFKEQRKRNFLNTIIDDNIKQRISELATLLTFIRQDQDTVSEIQLFGTMCNISTTVADKQKSLVERMLENQAKSFVQLEAERIFEEDSAIPKVQHQAKERKFSKHKDQFRFSKKVIIFTVFFYICSIGLGVFILSEYQKEESKLLKVLVEKLNDNILMEDDFVREEFYRTIDVAMLSNIFRKQIDIHLFSPQKAQNLVNRLLTSIQISISKMKERHRVDAFTVRPGIRTDILDNPNWIFGYNSSMEMKIYKKQLQYIRILRTLANILQTYSNVNGSLTTNRTVSVKIRQTTAPSKFGRTQTMEYINGVLENKQYLFNPKGVLAQIKSDSLKTFAQFYDNQIQKLIIFFLLIITNIIVSLILVAYLVYRMSQYYFMATKTSQDFVRTFEKNVIQLYICVEEMTHFTKNTISNIFNPTSNRKMRSRKFVEPQSLKKIKLTSDYAIKLMKNSRRRINNAPQKKEKKDLENQTFGDKMQEFGKFYASRLAYPFLRMLVFVAVFYSMFSDGWSYGGYLINYQIGLTQLTSVNVALLNMFTTNMFLTFFGSDRKRLNDQGLGDEFLRDINTISSIDKVTIISDLFQNDPDSQKTIQKILYYPICKIFPSQIVCPDEMNDNIQGLSQKYSDVTIDLKILNHKLLETALLPSGLLDISEFYNKYIENYQSMVELMFITNAIKEMSFERLKKSLPVEPSQDSKISKDFYLLFFIGLYFSIDALVILFKIHKDAKVISEEFLRIGNYLMYEKQDSTSKGYHRYLNLAAKDPLLNGFPEVNA